MCVLFSRKRCQVKVLWWQHQIFREECVQVRYMLPRFNLWNSYGMDCNCRKREEESKRKEAKLQKGMQNVEQNKFWVQQNPANREKATSVPQLPNKAADTQSKRILSLNASQIQPGRNSRGSPKAGHNKGAPKESCLSVKPQSEGHKIRQGLWSFLIALFICFVHFLGGIFYIGPILSFCDFIFFHHLSNLCSRVELDTHSFTLCEVVKNTSILSYGVYKNT